MKYYVIILCVVCIGCKNATTETTHVNTSNTVKQIKKTNAVQSPFVFFDSLFAKQPDFIAKGFDFPVGKPNAHGYYNAQKFTKNDHLGDDWNGTGGGNTDLGDPIYSIGNGYVYEAINYEGGWGNVVHIIHKYKNKYYESIYAHCDTILVKKGNFVKKGTQIGTIGNVGGIYYAHLHLEVRDSILMDIGGGYGKDTSGYLDPTLFIKSNRK